MAGANASAICAALPRWCDIATSESRPCGRVSANACARSLGWRASSPAITNVGVLISASSSSVVKARSWLIPAAAAALRRRSGSASRTRLGDQRLKVRQEKVPSGLQATGSHAVSESSINCVSTALSSSSSMAPALMTADRTILRMSPTGSSHTLGHVPRGGIA